MKNLKSEENSLTISEISEISSSSEEKCSEEKYFKRLDLIRIISCVMVLLYHLNILKGGFLAVCTFFSLSGYLSLSSALNKNEFSIKRYYINKIKKIYIPLLIVVSITVVFAKLNPTISWINLKQETISVVFGYNNFWQLEANLDYFTRHLNSPFMHFWYISILMQFDLIFPIIFIILKKIDKKVNSNISTVIVSLLTIASTALFCYMSRTQDIMLVYYNTFARSFSIIFGVLLALLQYKYAIKLPKAFEITDRIIFIMYALILITFCIFIPAQSNLYPIYMIFTTIISVRLIRYSVTKKRTKEEMKKSDKIVKFLAKCSYEIYLVQYPVIFFIQSVSISEKIEIPSIIGITFIISCILHVLINNFSKIKFLKIIKTILIRCNYCVWLLCSNNRKRLYC